MDKSKKIEKGQKAMLEHSYGPIAELERSAESPAALTVGGLIGGAAPLVNYFTVHLARLVWFDEAEHKLRFDESWSPLWFLVGGSFALSSKSVFRWAHNTFGDIWSALALVAMLEGTLILAPHWAMGVLALIFLVAINAAAYGSRLALRDQKDKAWDIALRAQAVDGEGAQQTSAHAQSFRPELAEVRLRHLRRLTLRRHPSKVRRATVLSAQALPVGIAPALPPPTTTNPAEDLSLEPEPAESLPTPSSAADSNYARAVEVARDYPSITIEELRLALRVRQPTARALMAQLVRDGVVPQINPSNRRRRPVLLAESA